MRHIVVKGEQRDVTHVVIWDDIAEQTRVVAGRGKQTPFDCHGDSFPPKPENYQEQEASEYESRSASYEAAIKSWKRRKNKWLGRTDLQDWDAVLKAINEPWDTGMKALDGMIEQLDKYQFATPRSMRRRPVWSDESGELDVDRYRDGQDPWRTVARRDLTGQQFVTLLIHVGANCNTSATSLLWGAAAGVAATEILEKHGYSVEIIAYDTSFHGLLPNDRTGVKNYQNFVTCSRLKATDQPIEAVSLVNTMSPWYFRLVNFGGYYMIPGEKPVSNLGMAVDLKEELVQYLTPDENYVKIENCFSREEAIKVADSVLRKFADPESLDNASESEAQDHYSRSGADRWGDPSQDNDDE